MNITIWVSLISSISSIVISLISFYQSRLTSKISQKGINDLETLKFQLENKRDSKIANKENLDRRIQAIGKCIKEIQKVKDILYLIELSIDDSLLTKSAVEGLQKSRKSFFSVFENESYNLEKEDWDSAHKAKNLVLSIEKKLSKYFANYEYVTLSFEQMDVLINAKNNLSDFQNLLRDIKSQIILQLINNV